MSSYNPIDKIIEGTIIGPLFEEFLFRIVFFTIITYIVGYIDNRFQKSFLKKLFDFKSILCWIIIVVNGSLFSLAHLPDISNFHLYFIGV
ncbi:type II CAAX prenyl endopeptidase Rce1 family protein [Clostridium septicum]|uniref:CPBP family glutamic-type intramembrane protease n=1 Tax=Clostridium septicum TaxID=1504 RepID=UPI000FF8EF30|nr:CPBP family intramembrane metalloprotease [Clostridium septicum]